MNNYKSISFFKGLNTLRFFAAFLVVMHHTETIRKKNDLPNLEWLSLFKNGNNAVLFFFVLSGFLITYLLLKENRTTNTISIKTFYLKRVLRIWPLYFLLVIIGTILLPFFFDIFHIPYHMPYNFGNSWYYFLFFVPGLVYYFFGTHFLEPLWSIGVEEVFYLIWAPLFKLSKQHVLRLLLSVLVIKLLLNIFFMFFYKHRLLSFIIEYHSFEAMAVGGLGAYYIFNYKKNLSDLFIYKKYTQVFIYGLLLVFLCFNSNITNPIWATLFHTPIVSKLFLFCLFLYCIIGVSLIEQNILKLENKFLSYLGEISYGIYMYHMLIIFAVILLLKNYFLDFNIYVGSILFYSIIFISVVALSSLSKYFFENYFLRLKKKTE